MVVYCDLMHSSGNGDCRRFNAVRDRTRISGFEQKGTHVWSDNVVHIVVKKLV
jgi:hypothetical protein